MKLKHLLFAHFTSILLAVTPAFGEEIPERFNFGFNFGASLPTSAEGINYSWFPAFGLDFQFMLGDFFSVGASTQNNLLLPTTPSSTYYILESALMPQALFHLGRTGFYAGARIGLLTSVYSTTTNQGSAVGWIWGPRVGYQYHFADKRIAIGPEWNMLFFSEATDISSKTGDSFSLPAFTLINLLFVMKWWF